MIRAGLTAIGVLLGFALVTPALAKEPVRGQALYQRHCQWCHGSEGDGFSPASKRLNPAPRDFTFGEYKYKSSLGDDPGIAEADLVRIITDGLPGGAMPAWQGILKVEEITDLAFYLKTFADLDGEDDPKLLDHSGKIDSSPESIAKGRALFLDKDRCVECHGEDGRGDARKRLEDDNGQRTWPRNLTKPWTFRGGAGVEEIFTRISLGIATTQMPSFADPRSKKKLSVEERWHLANYVASLAGTGAQKPSGQSEIIRAKKVDALPRDGQSPLWQTARAVEVALVPQLISGERLFTPTNDSLSVKALYDDSHLGLLVEFDDRTDSIPGNREAEKLAQGTLFEDQLAVQWQIDVPGQTTRARFLEGDEKHPVSLWQWSSGQDGQGPRLDLYEGRGLGKRRLNKDFASEISTWSRYDKGRWSVLFIRSLAPRDPVLGPRFSEGSVIPLAFANWDGSNAETGPRHTITSWRYIVLEAKQTYLALSAAVLAAVASFAGLVFWAKRGQRKGG